MIVKMKKVFLFMRQGHEQAALGDLGSLGLVHVEHENVPSGAELGAISDRISLIEQARTILSAADPAGANKENSPEMGDLNAFCRHVVDLQKRYDQLKEYSVTLNNWIDLWSPWGDFDPDELRGLQKNNVWVKLCQIPKDKVGLLPPDALVEKVFSQGPLVNCLVAGMGNMETGFKELELPKMSLCAMKNRLNEDTKIMQGIKKELSSCVVFSKELARAENLLLEEKEFYSVLKGMGREEEIIYLKGYIPEEAENLLVSRAKKNGWGILTLEPGGEDCVPTLLRNPAWVSLIKPVLKLLELVPGYSEIDISPLFIIFFSIFFGILIGDSGYGLVYFLLTLWAYKKTGAKVKDKSVFFLFYILSFCAIIWGLLSGTFFGQEWLKGMSFRPLLPKLNNATFVQGLCFFIGALHLSLAHGWKALRKAPSLSALADVGWILVIWAVFFLANTLLLSAAFPAAGTWLITAGLILVLFFSSPQRNILKAIGSGLGTIALSLVNNFTDVVSYIRLFAVGLATVAIADAFNSMAAGIVKKGDILTIAIAALVIVCGHMLNIILGPMSVLVHGVRLNVLEFCSHANVTWSGFSYKPFCKKEGV
jgi:V/A-type H+-transporting ATPase subunit I